MELRLLARGLWVGSSGSGVCWPTGDADLNRRYRGLNEPTDVLSFRECQDE